MQRRDKFAQVPPQKIKGHLDGEKLMPLVRRPRGAQRLFAPPVKSGGQRRENGFLLVETDTAFAFEVQADLDAVRMKTPAPIEFLVRLEVVPLETHARAAHAAVQMPPAVANSAPRRTFGERGRDADFQRRRCLQVAVWPVWAQATMCHLTRAVQISCRGHSKKGQRKSPPRNSNRPEGGQNRFLRIMCRYEKQNADSR